MKLALSGRLWESVKDDDTSLLEQFRLAREWGYDGLEIRKSAFPSRDERDQTRDALQDNSLELVFSPLPIPSADHGELGDFLNDIEFIEHLGGRYARLIPREANYEHLRRVASVAGEHGIKLVSQLHCNTLTDSVEHCKEFFDTLKHPNYGLIFDACHLAFTDNEPIAEAARELAPWTDVLNLQSYKPATAESGRNAQEINGKKWEMAMPDDPDGTDLAQSINAVKENGFDGWAVVMPAVDPHDTIKDVALAYYDFIKPLL